MRIKLYLVYYTLNTYTYANACACVCVCIFRQRGKRLLYFFAFFVTVE